MRGTRRSLPGASGQSEVGRGVVLACPLAWCLSGGGEQSTSLLLGDGANVRINHRGEQPTKCMDHDERGTPLSPKQWFELFKSVPPIGKVLMIVSQLIVLGVIGYVLVGL